jgi:hypothetical protein
MNCDYFEVTFVYNDGSVSPILASGAWEIGQQAGVSGVYRTAGGVDYSSVSVPTAAGEAAAILFAGKTDKTLLAVGRLYAVDGVPGTIITSNAKSVTFILYAIEGGVDFNPTYSSFLTSAGDGNNYTVVSPLNTIIRRIKIGVGGIGGTDGVEFPLFRLEKDIGFNAEYRFELHSPYNLSDYDGIRIAAPATTPGLIEIKQPRYTLIDTVTNERKNIQTETTLLLDNMTRIDFQLYPAIGAPFEKTVKFRITTLGTEDGSFLSFVFSVPVYALDSRSAKWYVRPAYATNRYDLDDGTGSIGGAILIGTGNVVIDNLNTHFKLRIKRNVNGDLLVPYKFLYPAVQGERALTISGLVVELVVVETDEVIYTWEDVTEMYHDLTFKIGNVLLNQDYIFNMLMFGNIPISIYLEKDDAGVWDNPSVPIGRGAVVDSCEFYILLSSTNYDLAGIKDKPQNIIHIYPVGWTGSRVTNPDPALNQGYPGPPTAPNAPDEFFMYVLTVVSGKPPDTFIIALHCPIAVRDMVLNLGSNINPFFFIILAAEPDVKIVRQQVSSGVGARIIHWGTSAALTSYWFGEWQYNNINPNPINGMSLGFRTYPYPINTIDRHDANANIIGDGTPRYTNRMIISGQNPNLSSMYNVRVDPGITVRGNLIN